MSFSAEALLARILYQDRDVLILDKPAGIAVHAGPKGGITLDAFLPDLQLGAEELPQLAHRLDRETSGCLVFGRNKRALARLGKLFQNGKVQKVYVAILCGIPKPASGRIDLPLARRSHDKRSWWMKVDPAGQAAHTRYQVLGVSDGLCLVALMPETGRTHQLRVHCAAMGWPIAGDKVYGGERALAASRHLQLHAARISLPLARDLPPLSVTAKLPAAMISFLRDLGIDPALAGLDPLEHVFDGVKNVL
jgi:tRNA pseudouridine32 synthase / 23S rRNA pseudouridine746 synthase